MQQTFATESPKETSGVIDRSNRTFIASVLFLDIVEYSKQSVSEQIVLKEKFNTLVSRLIADIPDKDRIVLDTGDGAALSFLGDPEDALFVAIKLRDLLKERQADEFPEMNLRMGINLGPLKLLKDINGRPNLIGDGINDAQRVMSFASPNQILVSRSFFDVVSRVSAEYQQLFSFQGVQADKHVREHELYEIGFVDPDRSRTLSQRMNLMASDIVGVDDAAKAASAAGAAGPTEVTAKRVVMGAAASKTSGRSPAQLVGGALAVVAALGLGYWALSPSTPSGTAPTTAASGSAGTNTPTSQARDVPLPKPEATTETKPESKVEQKSEAKPKPPAEKSAKLPGKDGTSGASSGSSGSSNSAGASGSLSSPAASPNSGVAKGSSPDTSSGAAANMATITFNITGEAEIVVNGQRIGSSSAVSRVTVRSGDQRVEIRECGFPPDTKYQNFRLDPGGSRLVSLRC